MTFVIRVRPDAQRDLERIVDYDTDRDSNVARAFLDEYLNSSRHIAQHPHSTTEFERGVRRINLRVLPYPVWYRCMKTPSSWKSSQLSTTVATRAP